MIKILDKIINGESKTITSAAVVLAGTSLASRLIGMFRDRILAGTFGAGAELDTYFAAFRIPDLIYNLLILGALSAGFIPVFTEAIIRNKENNKEAWRIANGVLNLLGVVVLGVILIVAIFADKLVPYITPGFTAEAMRETVTLTRIMFLSPFFLGLSTVYGGILQSYKRFFIFSFGPILYNVGIIVGAVIFSKWWGLSGLAWGVVLGAFLHMLIQLPSVYKLGYRYAWIWTPKEKFIREITSLMLPRTLGLAVSQLNLVAMLIIATLMQKGSVSIFNLANNFQGVAVGIIGVSFAIAAFPTISESAAKQDYDELIKHFSHTTRQILLFILPATILFLFLRGQIVRVVLGSGAFDWNATKLTADTLAFFTLSLGAQSLIPLLTRVFYALKDTLTPFIIGVVSVVFNVVIALWLKDSMGVMGLALAFSASSIINLILLWATLRSKVKSLDEFRLLRSVYKLSVATLGMALTVQVLKAPLDWVLNTQTFVGIFLQGFIAGIAGLIIYIVIGILLQSEEITTFVKSMHKKFFRSFKPVEVLDDSIG